MYGVIVGGSAALHAAETYGQYRLWKGNGIGSYLLPPYRSLSYFTAYAWTNFWLAFVLSTLASAAVCAAMRYGNKRFSGTFFYPEEPFLAAIGVMIVGYAYAAPYVAIVLAAGLAGASVRRALKRSGVRISLRMIWIPAALLLRVALVFGV